MSQAMLRPLPERAPAPALDGVPVDRRRASSSSSATTSSTCAACRTGRSAIAAHGFPFPDRGAARDATSRLMAELGANTLRTFTVPPRWLLDRAAEHGLRVLVTIPWAEHVCFLDRKDLVARDPRHGARRGREPGRPPGAARAARRQRDPARHRALVRARARARVPAHARRRGQAAGARGRSSATPTSRRPSTSTSPSSSTSSPSTSTCTARTRLPPLPAPAAEHRRGQAAGADRVRRRLDPRGRRRTRASCSPGWCAPASSRAPPAASCSRGPTTGSPAAAQIADWAFGAGRRASASRSRRSARCRRRTRRRCRRRSSTRRASRSWSAPTTPSARWTRASTSLRTLSYPNYEVVVVNDGSTDRTLAITRGAPAAVRGRSRRAALHPGRPAEQGPQRRAQRRRRGGDAARSSPTPTPTACPTPTGSASWSTASCAAASSPSAAPTSRRPSRAWCPPPSRCRRAARRTCCSTTRSPSTSRAATWPSPRRRCRR